MIYLQQNYRLYIHHDIRSFRTYKSGYSGSGFFTRAGRRNSEIRDTSKIRIVVRKFDLLDSLDTGYFLSGFISQGLGIFYVILLYLMLIISNDFSGKKLFAVYKNVLKSIKKSELDSVWDFFGIPNPDPRDRKFLFWAPKSRRSESENPVKSRVQNPNSGFFALGILIPGIRDFLNTGILIPGIRDFF